MYCKITLLCFLSINLLVANAQEKDSSQLKVSAYVDSYISAFNNDLDQQTFQPFTTAGARDNTFGVNVAQIGFHYTSDKLRGNFVYHDGDIPQATWSSNFNNLQEGNVGFKLGKNLWFDMGFFATHIGTESFLPKNNMLSQTSFITYNEPFYQAGAKLNYATKNDWNFEFWVINGYNRHVDNNDAKSVGVLIKKQTSETTSISYSNMYGRESADGDKKQMRFYNNFYFTENLNEKLFVVFGIDFGTQTNSKIDGPSQTASMFALLTTFRYQFNSKYSVTIRGELSEDEDGFINGIYPNVNNQFQPQDLVGINLYGASLGGEYKPNENGYVRLEGRYLEAKNGQNVFIRNGRARNERLEVMFTMGFFLDKVFKL